MKAKATALPVTIEASKHLTLYRNMSAAIAKCHAIDEVKDIADKSAGLAAYYKQVKDVETERLFYQVKLRAWRRIGELLSTIDLSGCETQSAKVKKIRASFDDAVVAEISDSKIIEVLKLTALSDADFEFALKRMTSGGIATLLQWHTPQAVAQIKANRDQQQHADTTQSPQYIITGEAFEHHKQLEIQQRHEYELMTASTALAEVGLTLERKDRANMKQVVFLIKEEVHAVMRQAAFDQKITMQEVLRRGLKMWLIAHGYEFPEQETVQPRASGREARA
jgi:hypothetical protein